MQFLILCELISVGNLHMKSVNDGESPGDKGFVFGANWNSSGAEATSAGKVPVTPLSDEEEFSTPVGDRDLGSEFTKEHSDGVLGKLDNDKPENIRPCSESASCETKSGLGFDSGENGSWKSVKNPDASEEDFQRRNTSESKSCSDTCRKSNSVQNANGQTIDGSEFNLPAEMKKLNISDTSDYGGNGYEEARKSSNAPAFIFGSAGKVDAKYNGAATSGPCSFSSNGFHQSDNAADKIPTFHFDTTNNINNLTSTTFGTRTSFTDFKVPQWDPSSLKNSLFPEVSRNQGHARRNRSSKDQRSKKVKEKMKQHETNRCNDQASEGVESQEQVSSPGYCSPMDFSPYKGEKASNQFPTGPPLSSIDFSFSASTSQGKIPYKKLQAVKKYRRKVNNSFPKNNLNATMRNNQENQPVNTGQAKHESGSTSVMPDVCEVWRLRYHILTQELQHWRFLNTFFLRIERSNVLYQGKSSLQKWGYV